ncbi:hypothetical protein [Streptomyces maremycinicus]|uniref:hypothetical protein n=1 Tax=Streptomyces maremycinicus TaxID=1679753 RepID=UPI000AD6DB11|nr:hypothetical protein [Streptomyces sp. NBRC 110468]
MARASCSRRPASPLNRLYVDAEHRRRRDPFLRAEDARWTRWSEHSGDSPV